MNHGVSRPFYISDQFEEDVELLRDDGISEGLNSVHPIGYPISHSAHVGFRRPIVPRGVASTSSIS